MQHIWIICYPIIYSNIWRSGGNCFTTFNKVSIFTTDRDLTNIFTLHCIINSLVHSLFSKYYLSLEFSIQFCSNKNTINVLSKYSIIVGSKNALLTNATKPHVSDIMSQAWFYVATSISGLEWDWRCWHQKAGIFHLILSQKMGMLGH